MSVCVCVGLAVNGEPLPPERVEPSLDLFRQYLADRGLALYADCRGVGWSEQWGREPVHTFVFEGDYWGPLAGVEALRAALDQDAVAWFTGEASFAER